MLYKHSKPKEIILLIVVKVQEYGNQSLKEHITSRIVDDRKLPGPPNFPDCKYCGLHTYCVQATSVEQKLLQKTSKTKNRKKTRGHSETAYLRPH
jgi:hypothetical protein